MTHVQSHAAKCGACWLQWQIQNQLVGWVCVLVQVVVVVHKWSVGLEESGDCQEAVNKSWMECWWAELHFYLEVVYCCQRKTEKAVFWKSSLVDTQRIWTAALDVCFAVLADNVKVAFLGMDDSSGEWNGTLERAYHNIIILSSKGLHSMPSGPSIKVHAIDKSALTLLMGYNIAIGKQKLRKVRAQYALQCDPLMHWCAEGPV